MPTIPGRRSPNSSKSSPPERPKSAPSASLVWVCDRTRRRPPCLTAAVPVAVKRADIGRKRLAEATKEPMDRHVRALARQIPDRDVQFGMAECALLAVHALHVVIDRLALVDVATDQHACDRPALRGHCRVGGGIEFLFAIRRAFALHRDNRLREESASPSSSRTVGQPMMVIGTSRPRAMRRTT
jgi:hypothetical protein